MEDALSIAVVTEPPPELITAIMDVQGGSELNSPSRLDAAELAAAYGRIDALSLLFKYGFQPDHRSDKSTLAIAVDNRQVATVKICWSKRRLMKMTRI